jgi:hypothetical protein
VTHALSTPDIESFLLNTSKEGRRQTEGREERKKERRREEKETGKGP